MLLRQVKYFVSIIDCNSFTEAAEQCFISQSAISQQINTLESELGVKLINRDGRKFTITVAGEYFYKRGKILLQDVEKLKNETVRIGTEKETILNVGYLSNYDGAELPLTLIDFSKNYPEVTVNVFKGTHEELYFALKSGKANIVLNDQRRAFSDEYENFVLNQSPAYIDVADIHPLAKKDVVTTADLEEYFCILVSPKEQEKTEQDFYKNTLNIGKQFLFAESLDEARLMAMSSRGYILVESTKAVGREPLVRKEVKREDLTPIVRTYCAFWKKNRTNYYIEEFADFLRKRFTEK